MIRFLNRTFTPRSNLFFYSLLLLITPFMMLQNYLQDAIGMLSDWSFSVGGAHFPFLAGAFVLFVSALVIIFRKSITKKKLVVWIIILIMWVIGQTISDYYLDTPFYHLQQNWHYFAYGIFAFLAYQFFSLKHKDPAKIILRIYLMAMLISSFDEMAQVFISSRVFDTSDIAKDLWGVTMGILFLFFLYNNPAPMFKQGWSVREQKIKQYMTNPLSVVLWIIIFTYILLFVSSSLSDQRYTLTVVFITVFLFLLIFFTVHLTRTREGRWFFGVMAATILIITVISVVQHSEKSITYHKSGLVVYHGIPLPYFDVLIFENGGVRFVDKKKYFNQADKKMLYKKASQILLIGSGKAIIPRMGFPEDFESQFVYNHVTGKGLQVIILPTEEACKVFNRLKKEKKKVAFLIHND